MARLCGDGNNTALPATFMSTENRVVVKFYSEDTDTTGFRGSGFKLKYERLNCSGGFENATCGSGCGGTFRAKSGVLTSPYYPENYPAATRCQYFITQPPNTSISYTFTLMDFKDDGWIGCSDRLEIIEWDSDIWVSDVRDLDVWVPNTKHVGTVCGTQAIGPLVSTYNNIYIG